jgi:hypothetical protein
LGLEEEKRLELENQYLEFQSKEKILLERIENLTAESSDLRHQNRQLLDVISTNEEKYQSLLQEQRLKSNEVIANLESDLISKFEAEIKIIRKNHKNELQSHEEHYKRVLTDIQTEQDRLGFEFRSEHEQLKKSLEESNSLLKNEYEKVCDDRNSKVRVPVALELSKL